MLTQRSIFFGFIVLMLTLTLLTIPAHAQGCSDAGACTLHGLVPESDDTSSTQFTTLSIGGFFGTADYDIGVAGAYLAVNRRLSKRLSVDVKLTSLAQSGNDISVFGASDVFVNLTVDATSDLSFTAAVKIPLADGGATRDGFPLPMDYQASLGTVDLITGIGYSIDKLHVVLAYQQPLTQNANTFFASLYPSTSVLSTIQSTNAFYRQPDLLLRVSYPFAIGEEWTITPSILPIYHIGNDRYTDEQGIERDITGSQGVTLNGNLYVDYALSAQHALQFNVGVPFIVRDARPDGLTRGVIATLQYSYRLAD